MPGIKHKAWIARIVKRNSVPESAVFSGKVVVSLAEAATVVIVGLS
jgi:ribosomal 50S subunit-recycling heat shock protein